ncbi:hypothetical protein BVRB_017370 isoform B, partial [Beta vulgaris subsp. vulgaris]
TSPINPGDDILSPPEPEAPRTPPNDLPPSTGPAEDISLEPEPLPPVTFEGGNGFPCGS